jgi:hypothetical protein
MRFNRKNYKTLFNASEILKTILILSMIAGFGFGGYFIYQGLVYEILTFALYGGGIIVGTLFSGLLTYLFIEGVIILSHIEMNTRSNKE